MPPESAPSTAAYSKAGSLPKWFPLPWQAGAECLFTHRVGSVSGRAGDMNGEKGWETDLV